jgi:hypothetical protein
MIKALPHQGRANPSGFAAEMAEEKNAFAHKCMGKSTLYTS